MKLRYYLRGIGIGVIVAAAICICASIGKNGTMTDAEVIARARELGMTDESTLLADAAESEEESIMEVVPETVTETVAETETEEPASVAEVQEEKADTEDDVIDVVENPVEEAAAEVTDTADEKDNTAPVADEEYVVIVVDSGNGSDTVARKMESAGLVSSASDYDKYLCANGYDRKIRAGSHEIPKNASEEEMAKILCSSN